MTKKTPEQISYNMKQVKSKGSEIEVLLQKELWRRGLRYRNLADDEGNIIPDQWLNVLDVIRYETRERVDQRVEYGLSADAIVDIKIDDKEIASVPAHEFLYYADKLKAEILNASGSSFNVSEDIEKFLKKSSLQL